MITSLTDPCSLDGEGEEGIMQLYSPSPFTVPQALLQNIHQLKGLTSDLTEIHHQVLY